MSSPFSLFRQHQRILMVVITGLSMISFVLLGAVSDPRQLPMPLVVIFMACLLGGIAWLAGLRSGKGSEWGLTGLIGGLIIGIGMAFYNREASAVLIDNGNISERQLYDLQTQRYRANQFVHSVFQQSFSLPLQYLPAAVQRNYVFGFTNSEDGNVQDAVAGELLSRKADEMGIVVSDEVVWDYINRIASKKGLQEYFDRARGQISPQEAAMWSFQLQRMEEKPLTAQAFTRIRQSMRVSEATLINALRNELKIRQAYQLLAGNNYFPPEQFWSYYQKMNVKQDAEVASVPVKDFVNYDAVPTQGDLEKLFNQYKGNFPGFTAQGIPEPGRPGFYQPRRFQLGYLEAVYEEIEPLMGEVTEEEIQKRYEEQYLKTVPEGEMPAETPLEGPDLPPAPSTDQPAADKPEGGAAPAADAKPAEKMPAEKPAEPAPAVPKEEAPKSETPAPEKKETPAPEAKPEEAPKVDQPPQGDDSNTMLHVIPATQPVAFLQAEGDAAPAADAKPAAEEKPAAEKPADKPAEKPTTDAPAEKPVAPAPVSETPPAPAGEKMPAPADSPAGPVEIPPAPPTAEIPPLDDTMKSRLRGEILRERAKKAIEQRLEAAVIEMSTVSDAVQRDKSDKGYLSLEDANKRLETFAAQNQMVYVVTPYLSYEQLADSEDYPIGKATALQRGTVADELFRSLPTDLYRVSSASEFISSNSFAYWKLGDKPSYEPGTIEDDPGLKAAVTEAWNLEQARPKALKRAEELAKMIRESDKPMAEALAEQTVTGTENSLFIPVRQTGQFTWMEKLVVPQTSMNQSTVVRPSVIPGVSDAGEEFFQKAVEEIKVGETGIAPNNDHTTFYVIKVLSRDPSTPEQWESLQKKFLDEGMQAGYSTLLQQSMSENSVNWLQQLFDDHEVVIMPRPNRM